MVQIVSFGNTNQQYEIYSSRSIEKQIKAGNMTERDGELLKEWIEILKSNDNISPSRAYKITNAITNSTRFIQKPFLEVTIGDLRAACNKIKEAEKVLTKDSTEASKKLSTNTQKDYISFLKRFFTWMVEEGYSSLPTEKIRQIKTPRPNRLTKTASMMLSEDDIRKLLSACNGSKTEIRDKALLSVLYEGALRIHEVALLKWGDVDFSDKRFVSINTAGKTGQPRYIPLPASRDYLSSWKSVYPEDITDDKPVFITTYRKSFTYPYLKNHIDDISKRAGVKHFVPHTLRHSRITNLARAGVSEVSIKQLAWGDVGSDMFSTYAHLVNNDLDREILKSSGIDIEDKAVVEPLKPRPCPRCYHVNSPEKEFCEVCGCPLDKETAMELDEMKAEIHDAPYYRTLVMNLTAQIRELEKALNNDPNVKKKLENPEAASTTIPEDPPTICQTKTSINKVSLEE